MKPLLCLLLLLPVGLFAQSNCDRYLHRVFPNVTVTPDLLYGSNTTIGGVNTQLYLDFYEPTGDTLAARPLILLIHGFPGDKTDPNIVYFCDKFASRGFAVASLNTTVIDTFPIDTVLGGVAVVKAMFDLKAAIRYFKQDYATANLHKIDTTNLFAGGFSWGALAALSAAFGEVDEFYPDVQPIFASTPGGIEGNSGNPGFSSRFHGVINIAGQITDVNNIDGPDLVPIVSIHGTNDQVSPYDEGLNSLGARVFGSGPIHAHADTIGLKNHLITIPGGGHGAYYTNLSYRDSTEIQFSAFFYQLINDTDSVPVFEVQWPVEPAICETAEPFLLSAIPAGGVFSGPGLTNNTFSPAIAGVGVHEISYLAVDSCGNNVVAQQQIEVLAVPAAPVLAQVSDSLISDATGPHIWYLDGVLLPGADSSYLVPSQSGLYSVQVTDANGCVSSLSHEISFIATSLPELHPKNWKIFPNPAKGFLQVEYANEGITQVEVVDLLGRPINVIRQDEPHRLTIQTTYRGLAVIRIHTERGVEMHKVVFE